MDRYYVNQTAQSNGDHEVHKSDCFWLSLVNQRLDVGMHANCQSAVAEAKRYYATADGCSVCIPACHKR